MANINEIKEKANNIVSNISVSILAQEKDISKELNRIVNTDDVNVEEDEKLLYEIEIYLSIKSKLENKEENYEYLKELANELRNQRVRNSDDIKKIPVFKIEKDGKFYYFLTREKAHNFMKAYKLNNEKIIEIEDINNEKISKLIQEIERNF